MQEEQHLHFHGDDVEPSPSDKAGFHVIPVPLERSVSYGGGTAEGPAAILAASAQLELYDGVSVPADAGIYTAPPVDCSGAVDEVLQRVGRMTGAARSAGAIPIVLGGEHTVTVGAVRGVREAGETFGVVQFDAHADLRETYEGDPLSHACAARRLVDDGLPLFQLGVRALSPGEVTFRQERDIPYCDARELVTEGFTRPLLPDAFPERVYVTFDVDAFDPSLMPATGTPEPGGLDWYLALDLLETVIGERQVVGFDVVELAPIPHLHHCAFTAARLVYNVMGFLDRGA